MSIRRVEPGARLSQAVVHGNTVYLAGQVAEDYTQDIAGQTRQVLAAIDRLLLETGSGRDKVLSVTIYLKSMHDFGAMNAVWDTWVQKDAKPARATVEAKLAAPQYLVEMQVIAAR